MTGGDRPAPRTRAQQKAETRERLLRVAGELFGENDFGAVTVSDIAARAGVAHGVVFHHFGSKEGIYRAVLDGVVAEMDSAFEADASDDPLEAIRRGLHAHLGYIADHPGLAIRLITGAASTDPAIRDASQVGRERVLRLLTDHLGVNRDDEAVAFVGTTVVAAVDEASVQWVRGGCRIPVDDLVDWLIGVGVAAIRGASAISPGLDVGPVLSTLFPDDR